MTTSKEKMLTLTFLLTLWRNKCVFFVFDHSCFGENVSDFNKSIFFKTLNKTKPFWDYRFLWLFFNKNS